MPWYARLKGLPINPIEGWIWSLSDEYRVSKYYSAFEDKWYVSVIHPITLTAKSFTIPHCRHIFHSPYWRP